MASSSLSTGLPQLCRRCAQSLLQPQQRRRVGTRVLAKRLLAHDAWQERAKKIDEGEVQNTWDMLVDRGYIKDVAGKPANIRELMKQKRIGAYVGIDPTASSLHVGHLLPLMPLFWMYLHGYTAVSLIGGATARIGDPTGRLKDREAMSNSEISMNIAKIHYQLKKLWLNVDQLGHRFGYEKEWARRRQLANNNNWWNKMPFYEVMKRLGTHIRMGPMLSRDTVKTKMTEGDGMSFAEFAYPLMQGWDWWQLYRSMGVQMQIGGSDQYGNIVTGIETVKTVRDSEPAPHLKMGDAEADEPIGFTVPLLTDSSGAKFGKSAGNALWLDGFTTVPFDLYGYFMRRPDDDVEKLLKLLTFLPLPEIEKIMEQQRADPPKRVAHHALALEVVSLVHGSKEALEVQQKHLAVFGGHAMPLFGDTRTNVGSDYEAVGGHPTTLNNAPKMEMQLPESLIRGPSIPQILYAAGLVKSKSEGSRLIIQGGAYVGAAPGKDMRGMNAGSLSWTPLLNWKAEELDNFLIDGRLLLLRKGKANVRTVEVVPDADYAASGQTYPGQAGGGGVRQLKQRLLDEAAAEGQTLTNTQLKAKLEELALAEEEARRVTVANNPGIAFPTDSELHAAARERALEGRRASRREAAAPGKRPAKPKPRLEMRDAEEIVAKALWGGGGGAGGEGRAAAFKAMGADKIGPGRLRKQLKWTKQTYRAMQRQAMGKTPPPRWNDSAWQRGLKNERERMRSEAAEEEEERGGSRRDEHWRRPDGRDGRGPGFR